MKKPTMIIGKKQIILAGMTPFTGTTVDSCDTADSGAITGLPTYLCLFSACCPDPSCALYPQVGRLYITILIFLGAKSRISP